MEHTLAASAKPYIQKTVHLAGAYILQNNKKEHDIAPIHIRWQKDDNSKPFLRKTKPFIRRRLELH